MNAKTGVSVGSSNDPMKATPPDADGYHPLPSEQPRSVLLQIRSVITTRTPYWSSPALVLRRRSVPGSSVVTSTSNGARSSATASKISMTLASSTDENEGSGWLEMKYGHDTRSPGPYPSGGAAFHGVPEVVCPSKSRYTTRSAPGRECSSNGRRRSPPPHRPIRPPVLRPGRGTARRAAGR